MLKLLNAQGNQLVVIVNNRLMDDTQILGTSIVHVFMLEWPLCTHKEVSIGMVYSKRALTSWMVLSGLINARLALGHLLLTASMQIHLGRGGIIRILVCGMLLYEGEDAWSWLRCSILWWRPGCTDHLWSCRPSPVSIWWWATMTA